MHGTCCLSGVVALCIALGLSAIDASASIDASPGEAGTDRVAGTGDGFRSESASPSIGISTKPPALIDAPPLASPSFFDGILAQRVLTDDEEKPKREGEDEEPERLTRKNPWVAMGLSAVPPGAGQFYLDKGNPLAFAYVGVEALALYLHFSWEADGDEKTKEFEEYAWKGIVDPVDGAPRNEIVSEQGHWSWVRWRESFGQPEGCLQPENINYTATDSTLVHFWFDNRREFYEDIGKYDKYDCGWLSPEFRDIYRSMRNETNDILERARLMTQVVLLNHLASSIHAFFLARSHNNRVEELEREASLRQLRWQFSPDPEYRGLRAELWLTQRF